MVINHSVFLIIFAAIICGNETKKITKTLYFLSNVVEYEPLYFQYHSITIGEDRLSLNIIVNLTKNFPRDPWEDVSLSVKDRNANNFRPLFTYDINVCNILGKEGSQTNKFIIKWVNNFWKYGNLPKRCPIVKGNYTWLGLRADKLNIPQFMPTGQYRAIINTYFRKGTLKESVANLTFFAELK